VHVVQPKKSAKPKKDKGDSDDEEKKAGVSKPSPKLTKGESPHSDVQPTVQTPLSSRNRVKMTRRKKLGYQIRPQK
jgi:hypothetical protein